MKTIRKKIKSIIKLDKYVQQNLNRVMAANQFIPIEKTEPQDIYIAGFPKSGNTWMQNLIAGVVFGIDTALLPDSLTQELVPDVHGKSFYKRFHNITFFKSHDLPRPHMKRVIHLVRDGRDVMVSYYAMQRAMKKSVTLEEMVINGKEVIPSKWYEHTRQWISNPYNADILALKYEDLINDPLSEMKRVMSFLKIDRSEETLLRSINGNSFNEMKRKERELGWNNQDWDKKEEFIRKGKVGSYKEEMAIELIAFFENEAQAELNYFNYLYVK
ncbi:sulfotransferase domain-containing protein [Sediminibacter sp. Hel_I_10]|uniref:sulfotransferase domain-containing protein n=1 Tax=Sediminibacter sp. Hel_I_10 TaxID=1392490 RepID=UPI00047E8516|nr:sulfotransferase domain-containing protein [Sediminibacter sp. Hel_I_10]